MHCAGELFTEGHFTFCFRSCLFLRIHAIGAADANLKTLTLLLANQDLDMEDTRHQPEKSRGQCDLAIHNMLWRLQRCSLHFVVFQIQPVISKMILPWFGGGPAVWTSCMMFFQIMLLAGYAYAYSINRFLSLRAQVICHMVLVVACLLFFTDHSRRGLETAGRKPSHFADYSGPLGSCWLTLFSVIRNSASVAGMVRSKIAWQGPLFVFMPYPMPDHFFALLSFPFLIEPLMGSSMQAYVWAGGFIAFALFCAGMVVVLVRSNRTPLVENAIAAENDEADEVGAGGDEE